MVSSFLVERRYGGASGYVRNGRKSYNIAREVHLKDMKSVSRVGWWETLAQNSWFLVGNNIIHHIHSKDCQLGLNLKQKWIYSGGAYDADVSKFIGDTPHDIKVTPLGRRKWIDRKIKVNESY
ncbi:hypothetical protein Tco_0793499 [Tanacetum coccineum]